MSYDYSRVEAKATELIERFGLPADLITPGAKSGPDNDPTFASSVLTPTMVVRAKSRVVDVEGRRRVKEELLVSTGVAPRIDDKIELSGLTMEVIMVMPIQTGPNPVMYQVEVLHG